MIIFGYAKDYRYTGDGNLEIQVRIPQIHGPYNKKDAKGKEIKSYIEDKDLPYYPSLLLYSLPVDGDLVALEDMSDSDNKDFLVIGLMGSSYLSPSTNI